MVLSVKGSAANANNRKNGGILWFLLLEDSAKHIDSCVAAEEERASVVGYRIPVRVDQDQRRRQISGGLSHDDFHD